MYHACNTPKKTTCMIPATKKKKIVRDNTPDDLKVVQHAIDRCKNTNAYVSAYRAINIDSAKQITRRMGTAKWYRFNKDVLVSIIILNQFAEKIQRFFREVVVRRGRGEHHVEDLCPISLVPMSSIPYSRRFKHSNTWFDKSSLIKHMLITSDFTHPVTRVEFGEEDVLKISPELMNHYRSRKQNRSSLHRIMEVIQHLENELEAIFKTMVEAAEEIPTRIEFRIVFNNLSEDFHECYDDLAMVDIDRATLTIKSLGDFIKGHPARPVIMSRKRKRILKDFLSDQNPGFRRTF